MPKESVYSINQTVYDSEHRVAELRWGYDTATVQLATVILNSEDNTPITREVDGGWYVDLSRQGINSLIKKLRKARDQAFGKDE